MVNKDKMNEEAKIAFRKLKRNDKKSVREACECNPDDIYERCQRVSLSASDEDLEKTDINFPCAREDQSNLIPGLDDCTCTEKTSFLLISSKGGYESGYIGSYTGSVVVVKERRRH